MNDFSLVEMLRTIRYLDRKKKKDELEIMLLKALLEACEKHVKLLSKAMDEVL